LGMSSGLNQGSVIPLGFAVPRTGQNPKFISGSQGAGGIPTVYTAPANTHLYVTAILMGSNTTQVVTVLNDGVAAFSTSMISGVDSGLSSSLIFVVKPTKSITVDWTGRGGGGICTWSLYGFEA